jgi:hypothetical protein
MDVKIFMAGLNFIDFFWLAFSAMKSLLLLFVLALVTVSSSAFVKGVPRSSRQPTLLQAVKKGTKKASKKADKVVVVEKAPVVKKPPAPTIRKPEFLASLVEKTGLTKKDSEAVLSAVLETIQEVR